MSISHLSLPIRNRTVVAGNGGRSEDRSKQRKVGFVDYDKGKYNVTIQVNGVERDEIPKRHRFRYSGQSDWKVSEVVDMVLKLHRWEDIEGLLNRWVGRFSRKNFPLLIRVLAFFFISILLFFFLSKFEFSCHVDFLLGTDK